MTQQEPTAQELNQEFSSAKRDARAERDQHMQPFLP